MRARSIVLVTALLLASAPNAWAKQDAPDTPPAPVPDEQSSVTQHSVVVDGQTISYTATAATIHLMDDDGDVTGSLYYTAYTRNGVDPGTRPLSFIYNGGPGSASMWLHMGAFGPRRVLVNDSGPTPPPPYELEDNPGTLIDVTDMVFVDPIGTGFSRVVGKGDGKDYWGVDEDAASLTQFVTRYVTRNRRWNSPKFLMGESYGTTRSAVLVNRLQNRAGMQFNGVSLISSVLDFETLRFSPGHDVSYVTFLPTYAITAAYQGIIPWPTDLEAWLDEVRDFAIRDYALVLAQGSSASAAEVGRVRARLAGYTGLSEEYLERANLRVTAGQFRAELQRLGGRVTSRLDARYDGFSNELLSENAPYDPQQPAITGAYTAAINRYLREDLGFETSEMYRVSGGTRNWNWSREGGGGGWLGATYVAGDLEQAMIQNPSLKVQFENGYYDLATPFYASEWTTDHMILPDEIRANIKHNFYEAGHMMYVVDDELMRLKRNIAELVISAAPSGSRKP
ncbi:MAG: carboxypeptidase C (cathepsin A) [Rhodothermales bacterium]|jgi:carboxypeptidase C (cathepsin A)